MHSNSISGTPKSCRISKRGASPHRASLAMSVLSAASLLAALFVVSSCSPTMTLGKDFSGQSVTEQVKIGETKMETVLAVLGEPRGRGKAVLAPALIFKPGPGINNPDAAGLVDVWDYYFGVGSMSDVKQKMLL